MQAILNVMILMIALTLLILSIFNFKTFFKRLKGYKNEK